MDTLIAAPPSPEPWVRITSGSYREFIGKLADEDAPAQQVTVVLSLFGRPVRVKVARDQVVKIEKGRFRRR